MSTATDREPTLRVKALRDCVANKKDLLKGQLAVIPANEARLLAIDGRGGEGGKVCVGTAPAVEILQTF
jgi:hypothetical protein